MGQIIKKIMNKDTKKDDNDIISQLPKYWIKRDSKSRSRPYYFNTHTGQSVWNLEQALKVESTNEEKRELNGKPYVNKNKNQNLKRNLAEERLKKLQSNLKEEQNKVVQKIKSSSTSKSSSVSSLSRRGSKQKIIPTKNFVPIQEVTAQNVNPEIDKKVSKRKLEDDCPRNTIQQPSSKRRSVNERLQKPVVSNQLPTDPILVRNLHQNSQNTSSQKETKRKLSDLTEQKVKPTDIEPTTKRRSVNDRLKMNASTSERNLIENKQLTSSNNVSLTRNKPANTTNTEINKNCDTKISFNKSIDKLIAEPMDWEQSPCQESEPSPKNVDRSLVFETMEQYLKYKNLLNDQQFEQKCFYTVVDTNIFLSNLSYVESLPKTNYKNLGHPVIVVPYVVLQELDSIKHRNTDHELSSKAKAAINLIYEKLKNRNIYFMGQTAKDDNQKLISIQNPDDKFINCVMQVVEKVGNIVIALSNDKNLRNKVIVNGIDAYSIEELKNKGDDLEIF